MALEQEWTEGSTELKNEIQSQPPMNVSYDGYGVWNGIGESSIIISGGGRVNQQNWISSLIPNTKINSR